MVFGRGLTRAFGSGAERVIAVQDANIDAQCGEVVLLTGPSGSGKTTLLSMLGGILRPSSGVLRVAGEDIATLDEEATAEIRRRHLGFIFQGYNLFPNLRAWQNVGVALHLKGTPRRQIRRLSADLLGSVGLEDKINAFPSELSGGQKQRVSIARALAGDPKLILADEPTAALDGENGRAVMALLRRLASENERAVIIVTHDTRLHHYADRMVRMEDGRIVDATSARLALVDAHSQGRMERTPKSAFGR